MPKWFRITAVVWFIAVCILYIFASLSGDELRGLGIFTVGLFVAPLGLWLAATRTRTGEKQQISEEISRTTQQLGDENISVVQSGIETLRKLGTENKEWCLMILRTLSSHVRSTSTLILEDAYQKHQNKPRPLQEDIAKELKKHRESGTGEYWLVEKVRNDHRMQIIESALTALRDVIKRQPHVFEDLEGNRKRKEKSRGSIRNYVLDLSSSILINGDGLSGTILSNCNLSEIIAIGYIFTGTKFDSANLVGAYLEDCDLEECTFKNSEIKQVIACLPKTEEEIEELFKDADKGGGEICFVSTLGKSDQNKGVEGSAEK